MTHTWWAALKHGGLLIAPSRLGEYFPEDPTPLPTWIADRLRRDVLRGDPATLLETVFETVCGVDGTGEWFKGPAVPPEFGRRTLTGESIKPRRVWRGPNGAVLPVFWDDSPRLGVGRGRRAVARVAEWLRRAEAGIAVLTNGRQFRLIHAGLDYDAWAEWDTDLWFEEGLPGPQVTALRALLAPQVLTPPATGKPSPLVAAILATRKGQAELSAELGERVRRAVELLIRAHTGVLGSIEKKGKPRDTYLAAVRVVMRMVVALFAEARELLPRGNLVYEGSYGLQALREELGRLGHGSGRERLRYRHCAWPRVLALFRLIHGGSGHEALPLPRYDGALFAAGSPGDADPVARVLSVFEDPAHGPSDAVVHELLELLTRSRVKVRQGNSSTWVEAPVDFGDLSSEYIGILYEGLLDYELKRAAPDDPVVFLRLGDEPALPLSRLEALDKKSLRGLLEKLKAKKKAMVADDQAVEEEEQEDDNEELEDEHEQPPPEQQHEEESAGDDAQRRAQERALAWARRVAGDGANALLGEVVVPGQWYLVRFGGTRKGAGTFYTRPALAVPTAQRTLRPMSYVAPQDVAGQPDESAPPERWIPRRPEEILALQVCDPACGSGSFLVAALRFLTDALAESLHHHGRIAAQGESTLVTLAEGKPGGAVLAEDLLPCRPTDDDFEPRLRARLKRYVVEQCLYGVDFDPLAVELCRMALWVETMDRELPFTFLDHKIRCGNALVGCWFDRFRDYPALAWDREGGDKGHRHGVHFQDSAWTSALKAFRNDRVKPALRELITGQERLFPGVEGKAPEAIHDEAMSAMAGMHALAPGDTEGRARYFRERIAGNSALARLKEAFDTWCALWFWPVDQLDLAPLPGDFAVTSEDSRAIVRELAAEHRYFHWELEFPDVFVRDGSGFDAILGNPPWEIQKPNSKEYFSNIDPLYRTYGKQDALKRQREMFEASAVDERQWLLYCAWYKALANFLGNASEPFELSLGRGSKELHRLWGDWRQGRASYADRSHPFRYQGSADINTYKLFLEVSHALLRSGARFGLIVPSGLYTDKGTTALRQQLLLHSRWQWLFGYENREGIFDIHRSFKFCSVIVQKGGETEALQAAFMRRDVEDWAVAERIAVPYERTRIERYSPKTYAILEIGGRRDLGLLEKLYSGASSLAEQAEGEGGRGAIRYIHHEFFMTADSHYFMAVDQCEREGFRDGGYGIWLRSDGKEAFPILEGRMIDAYDFSAKGWITGRGRTAQWRDIPWDQKRVEPQFLIPKDEVLSREEPFLGWKVTLMDVTSATNTRTVLACPTVRVVTVDSCRNLVIGEGDQDLTLGLASALNSFVFDWLARRRVGGLHVTWFQLEEMVSPLPSQLAPHTSEIVLRLACPHPRYAPEWLVQGAKTNSGLLRGEPWKRWWAVTTAERVRLRCILDAIVAVVYGVEREDLPLLIGDCDYPTIVLRDASFTRSLDPRGFWRVDKHLDPELRHPVLAVVAYVDLLEAIRAQGGDKDRGITTWLRQNNGDGWALPESLRLTDYELGHDERAKRFQPVAERLGPQFLPWQLESATEESWKECELHARQLLGEDGFNRLKKEIATEMGRYGVRETILRKVAEERQKPGEKRRFVGGQPDLFE